MWSHDDMVVLVAKKKDVIMSWVTDTLALWITRKRGSGTQIISAWWEQNIESL